MAARDHSMQETSLAGVTPAATRKQIATSFLRDVATGRVREAFLAHVAADFRHHNAYFRGDAKSLMTAMEENARQNPQKALDVHHALEDGDLVAVHSHVRHSPDDPGAALVHLFRFQGNRIVELWDIAQMITADSPNENGIF
ncbi:MAG TPA: nuclear transport factor 2 family protein [Gemmatimonadaceae bacterium]|nr:nuclear transport factor 2 family protein [Gemmatimonadaceae bacterium]